MKTMIDNARVAQIEKDIKDLQAGGGGGSEGGNWFNYHIEIKAGGPVTIKDPVGIIGNYTIYQNPTATANMFKLETTKTGTTNLNNAHNIDATPHLDTPAMCQYNVVKLEKTGEIVKYYGKDVLTPDYTNLIINYVSTTSKYEFSNPSLITDGDYTLTVVYGMGTDKNYDEHGFQHVVSTLNSGKIHMIVSTDTSGNKTIKAADGETGVLLQYTAGTELGQYWYVYLIDVQIAPGWTE